MGTGKDNDKEKEVELIKFNLDIEKTLNDRLNTYLPWGTKNSGVRQLLICLDEYVSNSPEGRHSIIDLLHGNLKLVRRDLTVDQNLIASRKPKKV